MKYSWLSVCELDVRAFVGKEWVECACNWERERVGLRCDVGIPKDRVCVGTYVHTRWIDILLHKKERAIEFSIDMRCT